VGEYQLGVTDPLTKVVNTLRFEVVSQSAERRQAVRNVALQQSLAQTTGGKAYELEDVDQLVEDLTVRFAPSEEHIVRSHALWSTPLWFALVVGLMLGEWYARKVIGLI
jgi:hypothetical protein